MKHTQKEFLSSVFENALDAVLLMDSESVITGWNKQAELIFGWKNDEAIGRLMHETIVPERFREAHIRGMQHFLSTGEGPVLNTRIEIFALRRDGSEFPVELTISPIKTADGYEFSSFIRDISKRKRAESALRESEDKLRSLYELSPLGIALTDMKGRYMEFNEAFRRICGYTREELNALDYWALTPKKYEAQEAQQLESLAGIGRYGPYEKEYVRKDGSLIPLYLNGVLVTGRDGEKYIWSIVEDISERKKMEKEILERREEMEFLQKRHIAAQTAAAIAHELNQPLLAIATYSNAALMLMDSEKQNPDKIRSAIEKCERQAQRAGQSIRELLELLSTKEFSTEAFDLNQEIFGVLNAAKTDHELQFQPMLQLEHGLPLVRANRTHVQKVLFNLLHNSIDAMQEAGVPLPTITVTVRTIKNESVAQVTIQDNGPGIKSDIIHHMFEPFFTTKSKGVGMGLTISRSLIEENGGQLWVDPQEGPGAIFHLTLPFAT